jgi:NAD(P)-dependent dehydrogenase (short-subunit alcohol dehydrogenase family)
MLMSTIDGVRLARAYPEIAAKRVLITGLNESCGVDIARAFAEHKTRLVLQFAEESEKMQALAEIAARSALDIKAYGPVDAADGADAIVRLTRSAATAFGGLDVAINLVPLSAASLDGCGSAKDIEQFVAETLLQPCLVSKVAASRMAVCANDGLILNVAVLPAKCDRRTAAFAGFCKAALSAITRDQSVEWASRGVRFNLIAPPAIDAGAGRSPPSEPEIAALALYIASGRARELSGQVFEPEPQDASASQPWRA